MAKALVDFGQVGLVIGNLTWVACQRSRDFANVATAGSTLTAFGASGAYWLDNPNVTEETNFGIYVTADPSSVVYGEFQSSSWATGPTPPDASALAVCNNAVLNLGGKTFAAFDVQAPEAILCTNFWTAALDAVLRLHPWNFAVKRATLAPDVAAPEYEWTAAFTLPADYLRLLEVYGLNEYKVENGKILCDETALSIRYIYRNSTTTAWDKTFVEAMTLYMTWKLAYPLTKSQAVRDTQWKYFTEFLRTAKNIDAQEEPQDTVGDFPFLNARSY